MNNKQETIVISQSFKAGNTCVIRECSDVEKDIINDKCKVVSAAVAFFRAAHDKFEFNGAGTTLYTREVSQAVLDFLKSGETHTRIKDAMYDTTGHPHFYDLALERIPMGTAQ